MLVGGANGAGCNTADAVVLEHQACHPRLFPSGTNTINWTRNAAGAAALGAATSTVMVVQWGAAWNVQRTAIINGNAGGDGLDAVGEYNTATIGPVRRAQTWVWGTGHTNDPNTGDSAEAVALTLGNGVTQNADREPDRGRHRRARQRGELRRLRAHATRSSPSTTAS